MITSIRLFGIEIFRLERISVVSDDSQFVHLGTDTELDEEAELDITAETYGFAPPSMYL